jgi:hypothetical protein
MHPRVFGGTMDKPSQEQRVEELSKKAGGRFRLTSLIQKQLRDYHLAGRAFMPKVRNLDELFELVLDQIEHDQIELQLVEEEEEPKQLLP